jgi:hypothetical protein
MATRVVVAQTPPNADSTKCSVARKDIRSGIYGLQMREKSFATLTLFGSAAVASERSICYNTPVEA